MKKFIITFLFALVVFSGNFITVPKLAFAQDATTATPADNFELKVAIDNPICDKKGGTGCTTTIKDLIAKILKVVIEFAIPVVVVMVIYSGFLYVVARGKPEAIETAHKTLTWTLIGAAIILGAQLISNVIIDTVSNISKDSGISNSSITSGNNLVNSGSGSNVGTVNVVNNSNGTETAGVVLNNNTTGAGANTSGANTGTVVDSNTQKDVAKEPTNSQGDSVKTDPVVNNSPVAGILKQYYVNAVNGARLRSEPNTNSDANIIGQNAYGTVLNVSGETNGFWNIFKSDKTFMGYTSKSLLTLGNKAPALNTGTNTSTNNLGSLSILTNNVPKGPGWQGVFFQVQILNTFSPWGGYLFAQCKSGDGLTYNQELLKEKNTTTLTKGTFNSEYHKIEGKGNWECQVFYYKDKNGNSQVYSKNKVNLTIN